MQLVDGKLTFRLALLAFPLFLSVDLTHISTMLDNIVNVWKVVSFLVIAYAYARFSMQRRITVQICIILALLWILLIATLLNNGSLMQYFIIWGGFFGVVLLIELFIQQSPRELLLALKIVLASLILLNMATVVLFPDGIWRTTHNESWRITYEGYWLLGHRNNFGTPILATILACAVSDTVLYKKIRVSTVLISAAALYSVVITWSATSLITTVLAIAIVFVVSTGLKLKVIKPIYLVAGYAAADVGIVFFNIQMLFKDFIEKVLNRSADLTGRTQLWEIVKSKILDNPLIGRGIQRSENNGLTEYNINYVHAHNGELDILYNSGCLGLACYIALVAMAVSRCTKHWRSSCVRLSFLFLILVMVHAITGLFFSSYACMILWLCLNADVLENLTSEMNGRDNE